MIPIVTLVVSVCVCLCRYGLKCNDALHCWGLWVCVCVCLFTMIRFVVKTKAIMTVTSASFTDHKTSNTHETPPSLQISPWHQATQAREKERGREGEKERKKWGRERSSLSDTFFSSLRWTVECIWRKKEKLEQQRTEISVEWVDKRLHGSLLVWVRLSSVHVSSETAVVV